MFHFYKLVALFVLGFAKSCGASSQKTTALVRLKLSLPSTYSLINCGCNFVFCFRSNSTEGSCGPGTNEANANDTSGVFRECRTVSNRGTYSVQHVIHLNETWWLRFGLSCAHEDSNPLGGQGVQPYLADYRIYPGLPTYTYRERTDFRESWMAPVRTVDPERALERFHPGMVFLGALQCPMTRWGPLCSQLDFCVTAVCPEGSLCRISGSSSECYCDSRACNGRGNCSLVNDQVSCKCEGAFSGKRCDLRKQTAAPELSLGGWRSVPVVASVSTFGVLVLMITVATAYHCRRRERKRKTSKIQTSVALVEDHFYRVANNPPASESLYEDPEAYAYADVYDEPSEIYSRHVADA